MIYNTKRSLQSIFIKGENAVKVFYFTIYEHREISRRRAVVRLAADEENYCK